MEPIKPLWARAGLLVSASTVAILLVALILFAPGVSFASFDGPHSVADVRAYDVVRPAAVAAPMGASTIGDYVWYDFNGDGSHTGLGNEGEVEFTAGIKDVELHLYRWVSGQYVHDPDQYTAYTDATGKYSFTATAEGNKYKVEPDPTMFDVGKPLHGYVYTSASVYQAADFVLPGLVDDYKTADLGFATTSLSVTKSPDSQTVIKGETAHLTIKVKNTGQVPLIDVSVSDTVAGVDVSSCNHSIGNLEVGQEVSYDCTVSNVQADFPNQASATGKPVYSLDDDPIRVLPPGKTTTADSNIVNVYVVDPKISVKKEVTFDDGANWYDSFTDGVGPYSNGTAPKYRFIVTNTSIRPDPIPATLTNLILTDSDAMTLYQTINMTGTPCPPANATLAKGASLTCYGTQSWAKGLQSDTATAKGTYTDSWNNTSTPEATDDAGYFGSQPLITVVKDVSVDGLPVGAGKTWFAADSVTGPYSLSIDPVYRFIVTNTGNVPLSDVSLSDDPIMSLLGSNLTDACTVPATLAVNGTFTCYSKQTWASGQHADLATAGGSFTDSTGNVAPASATDPAHYYGATLGITVLKDVSIDGGTNWYPADTPETGPTSNGAAPVYRFKVTNNSNVTLSDITLNDTPGMTLYQNYQNGGNPPLSGTPCPATGATLAPNASLTCYGTAAWAKGPNADTADTSGSFSGPGISPQTVTDTDPANYFGSDPQIKVLKEVSVDSGVTWHDANDSPGPFSQSTAPRYRFTVTNIGNVTLSNISLYDTPAMTLRDSTLSVACNIPATLAVNDSFSCYATTAWVLGTHKDTATAGGSYTDTSNNTKPATASDDAYYTAATPTINLIKTAGNAADGAILVVAPNPAPAAPTPVQVTYHYRVENTSTNVWLKDIQVTDDKISGTLCTIPGPLAPGAYDDTCTATAPVSVDTQNVGTVNAVAQDAAGNVFGSATDQDDAWVQIRGGIGDYVWWDVNANGIQESGEPGIPGVHVTIPTLSKSVTTSTSGNYFIPSLDAASYTLVIPATDFASGGVLAGFTRTTPLVGNSATDSNGAPGTDGATQAFMTLPSYVDDLTIDFGFVKPTNYELTKKTMTTGPVAPGMRIDFDITIKNTGQTWITQLPLIDTYESDYLTYGYNVTFADPKSDSDSVDNAAHTGTISWNDVTSAMPSGVLAPGESLTVHVTFTAKADTTAITRPPAKNTINQAKVPKQGTLVDPDNAGDIPAATTPLGDLTAQDVIQIIMPTGIQTAQAGVSVTAEGVLVTWESADESSVLGYNVLRGTNAGDLAPVNGEIVLAKAVGMSQGAAYSFLDTPVAGAYIYALEVIGLDGAARRVDLGPVTFGR